jgi:hypothetical protein
MVTVVLTPYVGKSFLKRPGPSLITFFLDTKQIFSTCHKNNE